MAKAAAKENQFDDKRETLVVECKTTWTEEQRKKYPENEREHLAGLLHSTPKEAKKMVYVRTTTGLIRHISVTDEDLARIGK